MNNYVDFYFDLISPYSFIAFKKLLKIKDVDFRYKPILLGGLHNLAGITPPAFNKYKSKNLRNDCELVASKNNINFQWNKNFPINSLNMMRGYLCVEQSKKKEYLETFFEAYWVNDIDLTKNENINLLLDNLNIDKDKFFNDLKNQSIKDELKKVTNDAFERDVFGAPTFIVNKKLFWGQDRLEYAIEELKKN